MTMPRPLTAETWNSGAPDTWPPDRSAPSKDFSIRRFDFLHVGTNVLALQGLNNGLASSDLLVMPELLATVVDKTSKLCYFPTPTPGQPNGSGVDALGPIITDVNHFPLLPTLRNDLKITRANFRPASIPWIRSSCTIG